MDSSTLPHLNSLKLNALNVTKAFLRADVETLLKLAQPSWTVPAPTTKYERMHAMVSAFSYTTIADSIQVSEYNAVPVEPLVLARMRSVLNIPDFHIAKVVVEFKVREHIGDTDLRTVHVRWHFLHEHGKWTFNPSGTQWPDLTP